MNSWCVVYTQAQSEAKAAGHLRRQGFNVYLPEYYKLRRHARKKERIKSPLFSRYLFVALDMTKDRWRAINSTIAASTSHADGPKQAVKGRSKAAKLRAAGPAAVLTRHPVAHRPSSPTGT